MSATKYNVEVQSTKGGEFVATEFTRSEKAKAVAEANRITQEQKFGARVVTGAGNVVHENAYPKQRVITVFTKPFTKVIELDEELQTLVPEGYVAAYRRPRNGAIVLRREVDVELEDGEQDEARYLVISEAEGARVGFAPTTRVAGKLMQGLKAGEPIKG